MRRSWVLLACSCLAIVALICFPAVAWGANRPATRTHPLIGLQTRPAVGTHPLMGTTTTSSNWSGYDDSTDGPFTSVTASWVQPAIRNAGATFTDAAFWVGLDGDNSDTVEQIGTEGYSEGVVGYDAWYEMYPAAPVPLDMSIRPGDSITASVSESGAIFTLSLVDRTTAVSYQAMQTMNVPPALASAEVIAEAPSSDEGIVPIADFGTMAFTGCAFDGQPISAYDWNRIDMISEDYDEYSGTVTQALIDQALPLSPDGTSFSVTTDVTAPHTIVLGADSRWHHKPVTLRFLVTDNPGGSGVAYTEYSLNDGVTWVKADSATIPAPADHSNDGIHKVVYRSVDNVGNVEARRICLVRIDTTAPTPIANWPASVKRRARAALRYLISDPPPGGPDAAVTIEIVNAHGRLAKRVVLPVTVNHTHDFVFRCTLPKGHYRFTVSAIDAAGNRGSTVAVNTLVVR